MFRFVSDSWIRRGFAADSRTGCQRETGCEGREAACDGLRAAERCQAVDGHAPDVVIRAKAGLMPKK